MMVCNKLLLIFLGLLSSTTTLVDARVRVRRHGHIYKEHDQVHIVVNKVGPFNNPTETYRYYSLPFCHEHHSTEEEEEENEAAAAAEEDVEISGADESVNKRQGRLRHKQRFGESIVGDRRGETSPYEIIVGDRRGETSPYEISFLDSVDWRLLCKKLLQKEDLQKLKDAIHNTYFFEMFVEDLPMWGYIGEVANEDILVGEVEGNTTHLFTHLHFTLGHNNGQIVSAKVTTDQLDRRVDITHIEQDLHVKFSYAVEWIPEPDLPWKNRMTRYADSRFLPTKFEIHWLAIINSTILVLLLTAYFTIILLQVLKDDFMKEEESGWKLIHGDVFRFPTNPIFFCAAVGVGNQLSLVTFFHLCLALTGLVSTTRSGSILAGVVVLYCLTSFVGGYTSVRLFRQMNQQNWVQCIIVSALLFPAPCVFVFMWVNSIALVHGSTSALPFTAILTVTALFAFISFPLTVFGGIMAKNYASTDFGAPTRTTKVVAREIPTEIPRYRFRTFQIVIAGFFPFSAIYNELHYIFASMWGHQIYTLFGILLLAFFLLVIVASFITVTLLYFQLAREDHRWWWASYINGGMTGVFIYAYSFYYYYFNRSGMSGVLQSSFYFGYMAVVSFAFFLMLGSAGFQFSLVFVKYIYSQVNKCD